MALVRSRWLLVIIVAVAFALRLIVWRQTPVIIVGDMVRYDRMARHLVTRGYLGFGAGPDAYYTPGYPLFVALMYKITTILHGGKLVSQLRVVHETYFLQQLVSLLPIILSYEFARRYAGPFAGLAAAILSVVYLPNGFVGVLLLTEALFIPLLVATVVAFVKAQRSGRVLWYGIAGALLGAATLVRPTVLPLVAILLLLDWWQVATDRRVGARRALPWASWGAFAGLFVLVMVPWWVRNAIDFHHFIPLSTEAGNPLLAGASPYFQVPFASLVAMARAAHESEETFAIHYIVRGLTHHFLLFAGWFLFGKLPYLFWKPYEYAYIGWFLLLQRILVIAGGLSMFVLIAKPYVRVIAIASLYLVIAQLGFLPITRYAYPIMILWLILIPIAVYVIWRRLQGKKGELGE